MKTKNNKLFSSLKVPVRKIKLNLSGLIRPSLKDQLIRLKMQFCLLIGLIAAPVLLSGCLAPSIIPAENEIQKISSLLIVPIESPPLEIIPDPLEDRIPVYRHTNNMSIYFPYLANSTFVNEDGIEIAGRIGADDVSQSINRDNKSVEQWLSMTSKHYKWQPSVELANQLGKILSQSPFKSVVSDYCYRLDLGKSDVNPPLTAWRSAINEWYEANISSIDYRLLKTRPIDAVLEIGISNYRVMETQNSLQVFMKLIKPDTGKVLARTRANGYVSASEVQNIMHNQSVDFKKLIMDLGVNLLMENAKSIKLIKANS